MATFEPNNNRAYSQEDVQRILQLAIARQSDDQEKEFSYELLLEIAKELDISPDSLQLAEQDWRSQQNEMQQRQAFNAYRLSKFKKRLGNFAIINSFLMLINFVSSGGLSWALYTVLVWSLIVGLDFWNNFYAKGEAYERAFQKWYRQHQLKQNFNTVMKTANTLVNKWFKSLQI